ncbi:MAG: EAL domain-containing protein [Croceibacterium sp.]
MTLATPAEAARLPQHGPDWTWLVLRDPSQLSVMPGRWNLMIDEVRFARLSIVATGTGGAHLAFTRGADQLGPLAAPGAMLRVAVPIPGPQVRSLAIGFERIDDLSLLRKVTAAGPARTRTLEHRWLLTMGIFAGLLASAFAYNLFVPAGHGYSFQRWYLVWVGVTLAYGLTWANISAMAIPALVGPAAVRLDTVLVGLTVALACLFLLEVLEPGTVPRRLRRVVRLGSVACIGSGVIAADERLVPALPSDIAFNLVMLFCVLASLATITVAALRGSRVVRLYLIGWTPVIVVFALRSARNFGLLAQSDTVDLATFGAIAFETLVFSLLIADRFSSLMKQRDVAEASVREMAVEKDTLERAAQTDFLTGLGNRAYFHQRTRALLEQNRRFTLFLMDVDNLKELNDRYGHDAGDALLQHVGESLAALLDDDTFCARIGGDEFAVVTVADEASDIAGSLDAIQGMMWARRTWSGILSLSIGSTRSGLARTIAQVFQQADVALYEAKRQGRGQRQAFEGPLQQRIKIKHDMIRAAHWGLRRNEFALHFQPIIDLASGQCVSVEALLRWHHPRLGLLTPDAFECVMSEVDVGAAVQDRVMALAIAELKRGHFSGTLAVNFTSTDLDGPDSAVRLLQRLASVGVAPSSLCVEVTEGIVLGLGRSDPVGALRVLHQAGVRIALDDFGTGYASLVHLKEIPVDTLKIDRSFIAGLLTDGGESEEIVRAVLALGTGLKKSVIAEGVETPVQLARLREMGCAFGQGFLFGRPSAIFEQSIAPRAAA